MFGFGSKTIVGLDVGSSSIKAVELRKTRTGIEVTHLGLEPLASDIVVDSMIVDSGTVSSAISKLFNDNQIKSSRVATAVSGHSVIVKRIPMPSMSDQELAETIEKEAASHIPFDLADVSLDYQILSEEAGSPQMDVLLVAVKKDKILNYTNVLSMAGRTPAIVDIDALALQNCYEYNYQPAPTQVVALLNLGASVMNINIVKGTTPLFPRDVSVGGHQYTDSLQKELDLSFDDAESLKQQGFRFRTRSDTEFILHAYEHWGIDFVSRLRGMFAIAVCDLRRRVVFVIRDRFGEKPIVYAHRRDGFAFASTVRALLPWLPPEARSLSPDGVDAYLAHRTIPAPRTAFANIARLPPAHYLRYDLVTGDVSSVEYWRPAPSPEPWLPTFDDAIRMRTVADRPLGLFLSAGVDSGAVACRLAAMGFIGMRLILTGRPRSSFATFFASPGVSLRPATSVYSIVIRRRLGSG